MKRYSNRRNLRQAAATLAAALMMFMSAGCTGNLPEEQQPEHDNDPVRLSFSVAQAVYGSDAPATRSTRSGEITNGEVDESGTDEGTDAERVINNLWVLLFSNDTQGALKYAFSFDTPKPGATADTPALTGVKGALEGTAESNTRFSSVKLVNPATYRVAMMVNTRVYVTQYDGTPHESIKDIVSLMLPAIETGNFTGITWNSFKQETQKATLNLQNQYFSEKHLAQLIDESNDHNGVKGIFAYYLNENFVVEPGYTDPLSPLVKNIAFKRWHAKVRVTLTNMSNGEMEPNSTGYKLHKTVIKNMPVSDNLFEGNSHEPKVLPESLNYMLSSWNKQTEAFDDDITQGIAPTTLFDAYICADNNGTPRRDNDEKAVKVSLEFLHVNSGLIYSYDIPLYHADNATPPDYVGADRVTKYTIRRNTLYELNLTFNGKELKSETGLKVLPWIKRTINDNNQIDFVLP